MAHLPDGPLGPALRDLGFERLGDVSASAEFADMVHTLTGRPVVRLQPDDWNVVRNARRLIENQRERTPGLPIFLGSRGENAVTLLIDVDGQVWFINEFVDITDIGCTELTKIA